METKQKKLFKSTFGCFFFGKLVYSPDEISAKKIYG